MDVAMVLFLGIVVLHQPGDGDGSACSADCAGRGVRGYRLLPDGVLLKLRVSIRLRHSGLLELLLNMRWRMLLPVIPRRPFC